RQLASRQNKANQANDWCFERALSAIAPVTAKNRVLRRASKRADRRPASAQRSKLIGQANCIQLSYWRWRIASRVSANDGLAMSVGEGVVDSTMCKERLGSPRMGRRRFLRQVAAAGLVAGASTSSGASARND